MKKRSIISFLAVMQFFALVQIIVGFIVVPAIWHSGQSSMETIVRRGGAQAVTTFQTWLEENLHTTSLWMVIPGLIVLILGGIATAMISKKPMQGDNSIQD